MGAYSVSQPKIRPGVKPDGTPLDFDRVETGPTDRAFREWAALGLTPPNLPAMRDYRKARIVDQLRRRELAGVLLFDPINIRYATDAQNMTIWTSHNFTRACFVSADGYVILWEWHSATHLAAHLPNIDEVRSSSATFFYFETGDKTDDHARRFAAEIDDVLRRQAGGDRRLAVDKLEIAGVHAFEALGIEIYSGQAVLEHARSIKSSDEIAAMRCAIATCQQAMAKMEEALEPGICEVELWSILHAENITRGGEWIETRILSSGPRTNPWMQECGPRVIQAGDLVGYDTDMVSVYGMCADLSRTVLCGDGRATDVQRHLFATAHDQITTNIELLKPGVDFAELTEHSYRLPEEFRANRYSVVMHGVGLCDEFPCIRYPEDFVEGAFDYVLQPGMTLCVESYIGAEGGREGVKLEDQVLITESGCENLTSHPFDDRLLSAE